MRIEKVKKSELEMASHGIRRIRTITDKARLKPTPSKV